jgi:hypothetical protein
MNTAFSTVFLSASILISTTLTVTAPQALAQSNETLKVSVTDITPKNLPNNGTCLPNDPWCTPGGAAPLPEPPTNTPLPTLPGTLPSAGCDPYDPWCTPPGPINPGGFDFSTLITLGNKIMDFILTNKPNAEYKTLRASVLPGGATSWSQLKGWKKPVTKVYRVEFKNILGKSAGGFDYRIGFIYGGGYQGKGQYIGQISFTPANIQLKTDRQLNVKAEILEPLNFGDEESPIAGAQLLITWHSNTTLRYNMNSIEYFFYGTGEMEDISNGTGLKIQ